MSAARSPAALVAELLPLIEAMQRIDSRIYVDRGAELNRQAELATLLLARIRVLEGQAAAQRAVTASDALLQVALLFAKSNFIEDQADEAEALLWSLWRFLEDQGASLPPALGRYYHRDTTDPHAAVAEALAG